MRRTPIQPTRIMEQEGHDRASCALPLFLTVEDIILAGLAVPAGMLAVPPVFAGCFADPAGC